jgi:predicted metalloprotease
MARYDEQRPSSNVEDRRGEGPAYGGGGGMGANIAASLLINLLFSRTGRRLLLPLLAVGAIAFVVFPGPTSRFLGSILGGGGAAYAPVTRLDPQAEAAYDRESRAVLGSTEDVWTAIFAEKGMRYPDPTLVLYTGAINSGCGFAQSAVGPFYCPVDRKLYLDLSFFQEMDTKLGAPGDFAKAYVIAHEVGHHVQNLLGWLPAAQAAQQKADSKVEANRIQVRIELGADCLAGVWAGEAESKSHITLEPGDVEEAINAAQAVGDDTLQRKSQGVVVPDSFTHGSAAQRMRWFQKGYQTRSIEACQQVMNVPYQSL